MTCPSSDEVYEETSCDPGGNPQGEEREVKLSCLKHSQTIIGKTQKLATLYLDLLFYLVMIDVKETLSFTFIPA